jgi:hypothetical protein
MGPGLARQDAAGRVFGRVWNRTELFQRSQPGLMAGYPDPLLTLPIMNVDKHWNSTVELLEHAHELFECTPRWLYNLKYKDYLQLYKTQHDWTVVKYVMEELRPVQNWTMWMSKLHMVTLHHVITVYNDMFVHMDGVM